MTTIVTAWWTSPIRAAGRHTLILKTQSATTESTNDGDFIKDYPADPGCGATWWPTEAPECDDNFDNDGDGAKDYPSDAGCTAASDLSEVADCSDSFDNDWDGLVDFPADPGCRFADSAIENPACDDGIDNDGDTYVDRDDSECFYSWEPRESPRCGLGAKLTLLIPLMVWGRRRVRGR